MDQFFTLKISINRSPLLECMHFRLRLLLRLRLFWV
ncbi:hypothetical protein BVRB_9g212090 [Beta vulgaris subsp. vulgaris]|nr:hypothetical protein BVRB_9g212090 [Beta vulgaris subsp. vulgaris]